MLLPEIIKDADHMQIGSVAEYNVHEKLSPDRPPVADGGHSAGSTLGFDSEDTTEHSTNLNIITSEKAKSKIQSHSDNYQKHLECGWKSLWMAL